jgi:hypothetical protein
MVTSSSDREMGVVGLGVRDSFEVFSPVQAQKVIAMKARAVIFLIMVVFGLIVYGKIIKNIGISKF